MADFDPSTFDARLAALVARCDYGQFALSDVATARRFLPHRYARHFEPRSPADGARLVTWTATYRGRRAAEQLVCDGGLVESARVAMLASAQETLDLINRQLAVQGAPTPGGAA